MTQGGPLGATTNIIIIAYNYAFSKDSVGMSSSMAIIQLIVVMIFAMFLLRRQKEN